MIIALLSGAIFSKDELTIFICSSVPYAVHLWVSGLTLLLPMTTDALGKSFAAHQRPRITDASGSTQQQVGRLMAKILFEETFIGF